MQRFKEADLLLVIGARLGEMTTQGYSILSAPRARPTLIHVHADANELGRVFTPDIAVLSSSDNFMARHRRIQLVPRGPAGARGAMPPAPTISTPSLHPTAPRNSMSLRAMVELGKRLDDNAIVTLDAGNHTGWPQRFLTYARPGRQLGPTNGAMGYSVPAAVAASLVHPDRFVIGFVGDGGFMMSGQEIATAVQHGGKPIILLFNNHMYGTIRMHQEREHPSRVVGTDLINPDFVAHGAILGAHGELVTRTDDFAPALERAITAGRPALIELCTDPEQISTRTTITNLRVAAEKRQAQSAASE